MSLILILFISAYGDRLEQCKINILNSASLYAQTNERKKVKSAYEPSGPSGRCLSPVSVA